MSVRAVSRAAVLLAIVVLPVVGHAQQSLTLTDAIGIAQRNGYQARAAASQRDAARARDRSFGARLMPQLALTGTAPAYSRSLTPVTQPDGSTEFRALQQTRTSMGLTVSQRVPFTGATFSVTSSLDRMKTIGTQNIETWSSTPVYLTLRQDIFRPNTTRWDVREQDIRADGAERQFLEAREDVAAQTVTAFFDLYAAGMALANAKTNAGTNDTLYTLNKGRFEVGKIGENDLLQSELVLLRSQNTLDAAKLDVNRAEASFRLVLNLAPGTPVSVRIPTDIPDIAVDTALAVQQALRNRSGELDLQLQDIQSQRRINDARLNNGFGATVQASLGFNASGTGAGAAYRDLRQADGLSLGVQVPLMQWGVRSAEVEAARMDRDRFEANAKVARDQAAQEAHFAVLQLAQSRRSLMISAKADTAAAKRFEAAYNRYVIGKIGVDNLYLAQTEKDQASQQYLQAVRNFWNAYYRLRRLTLYDFAAGKPIL